MLLRMPDPVAILDMLERERITHTFLVPALLGAMTQVPGAADRSYGIQVAKLAGLPPPVLARARSVLAKLEEGRAATGGIAAGLDDPPLFAAARQEEPQPDPLATAKAWRASRAARRSSTRRRSRSRSWAQ